MNRVPPHSRPAEEAILGGVLIDNALFAQLDGTITSSDFYAEAHQSIWEAIASLAAKREPIDIVTLCGELKSDKALDKIGGVAYLAALIDATPTTANIESYAKIVRDTSAIRGVILAAQRIAQDGYDADQAEEYLSRSEQSIRRAVGGINNGDVVESKDAIRSCLEHIEAASKNDGLIGIPTGWKDLDELLGGLQAGQLVIVAGRPSMGKSALAQCLCLNAAYSPVGDRRPCRSLIASLEMPHEDVYLRFTSMLGGVPFTNLKRGRLDGSQWARTMEASQAIAGLPIAVRDGSGATVAQIRAMARSRQGSKGLDLLIVDYLQLMSGPSRRRGDDSREVEVSSMSRGLKMLATELKIPVIAISQLNREVERRVNKRPMMADLRESGAIEQDADVILFVYRDEVYNKNTDDFGVAEIICAKQRNGPLGTVKLRFSGEFTRFENLWKGTE